MTKLAHSVGTRQLSSDHNTWPLRVVYSEKRSADRMFCAVKTEEEGIVRATELKIKGFDVWQMERALGRTTIARTVVVF